MKKWHKITLSILVIFIVSIPSLILNFFPSLTMATTWAEIEVNDPILKGENAR